MLLNGPIALQRNPSTQSHKLNMSVEHNRGSTLSKIKSFFVRPVHKNHQQRSKWQDAAAPSADGKPQIAHTAALSDDDVTAHSGGDLRAELVKSFSLPPPVTFHRVPARPGLIPCDLVEAYIPAALKMLYDSRSYSTTYRGIEFCEEEFNAVFGRRVRSSHPELSVCLLHEDTGQPAYVTAVTDLREALDNWKAAQDAAANPPISRRTSNVSSRSQNPAAPPSVAIRTFLECGHRTMQILYEKFRDVPYGAMIYIGATAADRSCVGTNISVLAFQIMVEKARQAGYVGSAGWSSHPAMAKSAKTFGGVPIGSVDASEIEIDGRKLYVERGGGEVGTVFAGCFPDIVDA
ncbi:hypothetical protein HDU90_002188 [Geranomyces variabilis]|nr:hypothetical protein HDU90_002188 [Geranomyces variabilis]